MGTERGRKGRRQERRKQERRLPSSFRELFWNKGRVSVSRSVCHKVFDTDYGLGIITPLKSQKSKIMIFL